MSIVEEEKPWQATVIFVAAIVGAIGVVLAVVGLFVALDGLEIFIFGISVAGLAGACIGGLTPSCRRAQRRRKLAARVTSGALGLPTYARTRELVRASNALRERLGFDPWSLNYNDDPRLMTAGDLYHLVQQAQAEWPDGPPVTLRSLALARDALTSPSADPANINLATPLATLMPRAGRNARWRELCDKLRLDLGDLPLNQTAMAVLTTVAMFGGAALMAGLIAFVGMFVSLEEFSRRHPEFPHHLVGRLLFIASFPLGLLMLYIFVLLFGSPFATFPEEMRVVGQLAAAIAAAHPRDNDWTDEALWQVVREIVADSRGLDAAEITAETTLNLPAIEPGVLSYASAPLADD